jgi:signal transduction histidine kinase
MGRVVSAARRLQPMVLAIAATFCAAGLVFYFQHRSLSALDSQTRVILRQISEQTATDVALEVQRTIAGPIADTLTAVSHPDLRAGRLDLVAREFQDGLAAYPHVDRFFVWDSWTDAVVPGEALFYSRNRRELVTVPHVRHVDSAQHEPDVRLERDALLGREILRIARRHAPEQHIYIASEGVGPGGHQALLRLFWTDARRVEYFAILGFLVDPAVGSQHLFRALHERSVAALLQTRGGDVPLSLRVVDDRGAVVFGNAAPQTEVATVPLTMRFYPGEQIASRLSGGAPARPWQIEVSAARGSRVGVIQGYWPTALAVLLMLVALGFTVRANRRAADLTRMQADFISHVSHQLKTPLSLLSAATETVTMERAKSPEKLAQYLGIIRGEVARLSALVQRILEYSRLQQQRGYEFERVELTALVRETVSAFEQSLSRQHFAFSLEEHGPVTQIVADPAAIEQVLVNLLDNAVKYSGPGRRITVRVGSTATSAVIEVVDQGIGINKADQARIFEKFYRGSGASMHREGFGLGLPIVQELVEAHRGRVEVESVVNGGSTFRIVLPIAPQERFDDREELARPLTKGRAAHEA